MKPIALDKKTVDDLSSILAEADGESIHDVLVVLTRIDWRIVILGIVRAEAEHRAASKGHNPHPAGIVDLPSIDIGAIISNKDYPTSRDSSPMGEVASFLRQRLDGVQPRENVCSALSYLAWAFHRADPSDEDGDVLELLGMFAGFLPGSVNADTAEQIVFGNASMTVRVLFANAMLGRDFRSAPPLAFWKRLEGIVVTYPEFLPSLFRHYEEVRDVHGAISLMKKQTYPMQNPSLLTAPLRSLFDRMVGRTGWGKILQDTFCEAPEWIQQLLLKEVIGFTKRRDALCLLFRQYPVVTY